MTINIKTTANKICCPDCKQEVTAYQDDIVVCKNCAIMNYINQFKVDDKVLYTIEDKNNCKWQVIATQDILGKTLKDKMNFLKQLMKNRLKATLNTSDNIIPHL